MHAALLVSASWHDEYFLFSFFRVWRLAGLMFRLRHAGMRPVSEALIYGYWLLVQAAGRPLIVPALALAWGVLAALLGAAIRPWRRPGRVARWAFWLGLPVLFLLAGPVAEMWYSPLGAFGYLPALGGVGFAALTVAGPGLRRDEEWIALAAALTLAALSAERGAVFALVLCPLLFADGFRRGAPARQGAAIVVPLVAAGVVMISLWTGHGAVPAQATLPGRLLHHPMASLMAAAPHVLGGILGVGDGLLATLRGVATRVLLGLGAWAVMRQAWPAQGSRWQVAAVGVALVGTSLLSMAAAFMDVGALCGERDAAFRRALDVLMVVTVAGVLPRGGVGPGWTRGVLAAPALFAAAALVLAPPRVVALVAEYRLAPAHAAAAAAMWRSGEVPGSETLEMVRTADGPLLSGDRVAAGVYDVAHQAPWGVRGKMMFFGKVRAVVRQGK